MWLKWKEEKEEGVSIKEKIFFLNYYNFFFYVRKYVSNGRVVGIVEKFSVTKYPE